MRELLGKPVTEAIDVKTKAKQEELVAEGRDKALAIIRVGEKADDIYYENSAIKKATTLGIKVERLVEPDDVTQERMENLIIEVNKRADIGGVLLLRPLPQSLNEEKIVNLLSPKKDIDGITDISMAKTYAGKEGFAPCTAKAVIEMLEYYGIEIEGKNVVVLGRSLVIGKPVAMMITERNGTVTICHSKTKNLGSISKRADILISSMGRARMVSSEYVSAGQIIIDVGINVDSDGKMCGDVDFDKVKGVVGGITPVPRGIGAITTSILMSHLVEASNGV